MNLNNYDQWLEQPYQDKENEGMERDYKLRLLAQEYSLYELIDLLDPQDKSDLHELIIEQFEETLLNAIE